MSGCGCGSSCSCGSGCKCGRNPDLGYSEKTTTETIVVGVAPVKIDNDGSEVSHGTENEGCGCGSNCKCDPCTCK
uniref:Metallothionein-like protein n=1 Tax=Ziziphus jujuba TaxID=326968 RepID=E3W9M4_ZIZJJ|nr:metallothionein [Ziziphus jujuba]